MWSSMLAFVIFYFLQFALQELNFDCGFNGFFFWFATIEIKIDLSEKQSRMVNKKNDNSGTKQQQKWHILENKNASAIFFVHKF